MGLDNWFTVKSRKNPDLKFEIAYFRKFFELDTFIRCCGKVIDLEMEQQTAVNEIAGRSFNGVLDNHVMMFYGSCADCLEKRTTS